MPAHWGPATITTHVTTSWNRLKAEAADIWPTRLSFPKTLQPSFLHSFSPLSSFYQPETKSVSVDGLWDQTFLKFVCYCQIGTFYELLFEQMFFLFQQKSCFSLTFIGIENTFAPTSITLATASDIKSINSFADTPWIFTKPLLAFTSPDYRSRISKKGWNFLFFVEKNFLHERRTVAKTFLNSVRKKIASILKTTSAEQRNFKSTQKERQFPSFLVGKNGIFFESRFFE